MTEKGLGSIGQITDNGLHSLVKQGYLRLVPQTYNDFLAASAAGIFGSNLSRNTNETALNIKSESVDNIHILQTALGRDIISRHSIHKAEQAKSIICVYKELNLQIPQALKAKYEKLIILLLVK